MALPRPADGRGRQRPPSSARPQRAGRPLRRVGPHFVIGARSEADAKRPRLMMALPKKLVPSSPVRNLMRRQVREAYRAALAQMPALARFSLHVQLSVLPQDPQAPAAGPDGRPLRRFARRPTDRALKRLVRAEIDRLLAGLA